MRPGVVASAHRTSGAQAVRFSGTTDMYTRIGTGIGTGDFTMACWAKLAVDLNAFGCFVGFDNASSQTVTMCVNSTGTVFIRSSTSGDIPASPTLDMTIGTWYYLASVHTTAAGTRGIYYATAGGTTLSAITPCGSTPPADTYTLHIGKDGFGSRINGSIACVRVWSAALTKAELEAELPKAAVQRTANLWAAYNFAAGPQTTDDSGNGRTLTQTGTPVVDTSGPPIT